MNGQMNQMNQLSSQRTKSHREDLMTLQTKMNYKIQQISNSSRVRDSGTLNRIFRLTGNKTKRKRYDPLAERLINSRTLPAAGIFFFFFFK